MRTVSRPVALIGILILAACARQAAPPPVPPDNRAANEAAIRAAIQQWSASAEAKNAAKFVSFYAKDGILMLEQAPDARGMPALKDSVKGMMGDPNFALSFATDKVEVARSGDLAYDIGTYTQTVSDPEGNPATQKGHYLVVWKKAADGTWQVAVDVPVSDPPEEPAAD